MLICKSVTQAASSRFQTHVHTAIHSIRELALTIHRIRGTLCNVYSSVRACYYAHHIIFSATELEYISLSFIVITWKKWIKAIKGTLFLCKIGKSLFAPKQRFLPQPVWIGNTTECCNNWLKSFHILVDSCMFHLCIKCQCIHVVKSMEHFHPIKVMSSVKEFWAKSQDLSLCHDSCIFWDMTMLLHISITFLIYVWKQCISTYCHIFVKLICPFLPWFC